MAVPHGDKTKAFELAFVAYECAASDVFLSVLGDLEHVVTSLAGSGSESAQAIGPERAAIVNEKITNITYFEAKS